MVLSHHPFADELLDFSQIDWPERVQLLEKNWIGRSEGADVVFRPRAATPGGLHDAARHALGSHLHGPGARASSGGETHHRGPETAVEDYTAQAERQTDIQREAADRPKTGVFTGAHAINPVTDERIPIWIADYVLMTYGTGAIMAVPAHDQRDFEFARQFDLEVRPVIQASGEEVPSGDEMDGGHDPSGHHGQLRTADRHSCGRSGDAAIEFLEEKGTGAAPFATACVTG